MNILIITSNVGKTAPGIVFERLIKGLSEFHKIDIIASKYQPDSDLNLLNNSIEIPYTNLHLRLVKLMVGIFKTNYIDSLWAWKSFRIFKNNSKKYDIIISFISSGHEYPLPLAIKISYYLNIKHYTYFVDAIPAPGWSKVDYFYKGLQILINKYLSKVDGLLASNQQMLNYQLTTFKHKKNLITEVVFNPGLNDQIIQYDITEINKYTFLFTGNLYELRNPKYVLIAFRNILKEFPNSTLEFVGSHIPSSYFLNLTEMEKEKIIIRPYTNNLIEFYKRSIVLLDIDAEIPNDIFLSSKIVNYLSINRIIISVTGKNSPSKILFNNIQSIMQCNHNVTEIENAMKKAISIYDKIDFSDRKDILNEFSLKTVVSKINRLLNSY